MQQENDALPGWWLNWADTVAKTGSTCGYHRSCVEPTVTQGQIQAETGNHLLTDESVCLCVYTWASNLLYQFDHANAVSLVESDGAA